MVAQAASIPNRRGATDYLWQWGQFLDHDINETPSLDPPEAFDIATLNMQRGRDHDLPRELVDLVEQQSLSVIIRRNTEIGDELQDNVFIARGAPQDPPATFTRPPRRR